MKIQDITVVITSFRSKQKIFKCLDSIADGVKIVVIENSNDADLKKEIETKYLSLECYLSNENLGYAKGNNLALSKVKTKYALILNPDARLEKDALKNFLKSAQEIKNFAIIAPKIQTAEDQVKKDQDNRKLIEVKNVKGFAMFLNLEEFNDIGFFDSNFFIYFEEIDLCKRLSKYKKKIFLDPSVRIIHDGGSSHDENINFEMELSRNWHWMWSSFYFYRKHNNYVYALLKMSRKFFSAIFKSLFFLAILNKKKSLIYFQRFSGILNSMLLKSSWYRPKIF
tara:strand:- start:272 stop:1117 length:846 start_codon:yes stop_codon:yes gene_type:complete